MFRMQWMSANRLCNRSIMYNSSTIRFFGFNSGPSTSKRSYYEILGVTNKASTTEIRNAFLALSKKYHPDVSNDKDANERFVEINEAYIVLSKKDTRLAYDAKYTTDDHDFGRPPQWQRRPPERPVDPLDEMYRRYVEELYRRKYTGSQYQRTYQGQRQENPYRDFRRDPPIWPHNAQRSDDSQNTRPYPKRSQPLPSDFVYRAIRIYFAVVVVIFIFQIIGNAIYENARGSPKYYGPRKNEVDPVIEERWRKSVFYSREIPEETTTESGQKSDDHKHQ